MTRFSKVAFGCVLACAAVAAWGQAAINGPAGGFVFDPGTQTIRAIIGAPGSAYLGKSVTSDLQFGSVAPDGISAIVFNGINCELIADLTQSSFTPTVLVGAIENPDQILWAQDSSAAVLYSSRGRLLQFVNQINQQPIVSSAVDVSVLTAGKSATRGTGAGSATSTLLLAVDPAAKLAAVAVGGRGQSSVYLVQNGATPKFLMNLQSANAGAFGADGSLYLADGTAGQVWAVGSPAGNAAIRSLPQPQSNLGRPVAIAVQGNLLYVAGTADNKIRVYDPATLQKVDELELDSAPSSLDEFSTTSFLVNAHRNPTDPVLLLQTSPVRSIIFIPSGANQ